ncbi:MAG: RNA-binding domain-containing protein, partial [Desulfurococcaceae archaeon]
MSKVELNSLKLRAFIYATESEEKVLKALLNLIPPELRDRVAVSRQLVKGHHGNPIVLVQAVLQGGDAEA